jgi:hypothetical protein
MAITNTFLTFFLFSPRIAAHYHVLSLDVDDLPLAKIIPSKPGSKMHVELRASETPGLAAIAGLLGRNTPGTAPYVPERMPSQRRNDRRMTTAPIRTARAIT